jgi:DNA-binding LytR/AlgR family response regulator
MKALIADDEPALRNHLRQQLQTLWPELDICTEVGDGLSALERIKTEQPDIAFLDIRMPGLDGLQVAREVTEKITGNCQIVFVTAYDDYAVEAFEQHAVDYLLKPFTEARLTETIRRLREKDPKQVEASILQAALEQIQNTLHQNEQHLQWIRASRNDNVFLVNTDDVVFFQSGDKYTSVKTTDDEYLIRTALKDLEDRLNPNRFWRVHRSVIVNVHYIQKATRTLDGRYQLKMNRLDDQLTVSRAYAHLFKQM